MDYDNVNWHAQEIEDVLSKLKTSARGLGSIEAEIRLQTYGPNELEEDKRIRRFHLLAEQVKNPLIAVLAIAAVISFVAEKIIDVMVIVAAICINTALGFYKEYNAEEAVAALRSVASPEARALRDCPPTGPLPYQSS